MHAAAAVSSGYRAATAGALNGLLPGAGFVYLGKWESAILSFVVNGLIAGTAVECWRHELYTTSITTMAVGSIFYLGGIVGAVQEAQRMNAGERDVRIRSLLPDLLPELPAAGAY